MRRGWAERDSRRIYRSKQSKTYVLMKGLNLHSLLQWHCVKAGRVWIQGAAGRVETHGH